MATRNVSFGALGTNFFGQLGDLVVAFNQLLQVVRSRSHHQSTLTNIFRCVYSRINCLYGYTYVHWDAQLTKVTKRIFHTNLLTKLYDSWPVYAHLLINHDNFLICPKKLKMKLVFKLHRLIYFFIFLPSSQMHLPLRRYVTSHVFSAFAAVWIEFWHVRVNSWYYWRLNILPKDFNVGEVTDRS